MFPLFHDQSFFQNNDAIRIRNGGQAVGNGDHGAPLACAGQRVLDFMLCLGIERRCRLIQQQDRWVFQQGAGNPHPLFFPA